MAVREEAVPGAQATVATRAIEAQAGPQSQILATPADIALFGGGRGGTKTFSLLLEAARHHLNSDYEAVIFRRVFPEITKPGGLWPTSRKLYPHYGATPFQTPTHEWRFPSGSRITFDHLQHESDAEKWLGQQAPFIGIDQVETFLESMIWDLLQANRSTCGVRPYMRWTANPVPPEDNVGGWLHKFVGWYLAENGFPIEERCGQLRWFLRGSDDEILWFDSYPEAIGAKEELGLPEAAQPLSFTFIKSLVDDNPILLQSDPDYLAKLEMLPLVERTRMRSGNWLIREEAGLLFNRSWFRSQEVMTAKAPMRLRYWDKAATEGGGAASAGVRWAGPIGGRWYIEDVVSGHWGALERNEVMLQVAEADGRQCYQVVEQEPGSGGKESAETTVRMLAGWPVYTDSPTGDKVERSGPLRAQTEAGNVVLITGPRGARHKWVEQFLRRCQNFAPRGKELKDEVDAAVGGFNWISKLAAGGGALPEEMDMALLEDDTTRAPEWRIE